MKVRMSKHVYIYRVVDWGGDGERFSSYILRRYVREEGKEGVD